jgi:hypothetical protein
MATAADFETADFSQVLNLQQIRSGRITLTTTNPLEGTYSALVRNGPGDYPVAGGQRTEITVGVPSDEPHGRREVIEPGSGHEVVGDAGQPNSRAPARGYCTLSSEKGDDALGERPEVVWRRKRGYLGRKGCDEHDGADAVRSRG